MSCPSAEIATAVARARETADQARALGKGDQGVEKLLVEALEPRLLALSTWALVTESPRRTLLDDLCNRVGIGFVEHGLVDALEIETAVG